MTTLQDRPPLTLTVERPYIGRTPPAARMGELGNTLSRARRARAITLEDVERDTHVSRRYLQALENEDFSLFPAPVYARGFLRTYARYLGLNPEELVRVFPSGELTVDITPLPTVARPPEQLINVNWFIAGLVAIFMLGVGLLFMQGRDAGPAVGPPVALAANQAVSTSAGGQVQAPPTTTDNGPAQGRPIGPIRPGVYPEFVGADVASALTILRDNDMNYVIVEVTSDTVAKGLIISQSPLAGAVSTSESAVTLVVSRGPASTSGQAPR